MWLLRLYPRSWRDRYGEEMAELLSTERWSPSLVIDLVAGAVDARVNPQRMALVTQGSPQRGEEQRTMMSRVLQLRCAGAGPKLSARDQWLTVAVMLVTTVVLTGVWLWAVRTYRQPEYHDYLFSFLQGIYLAGFILAMPFGSLKGRPRGTQAVMMGSAFVALVAWCLFVGFVASKI